MDYRLGAIVVPVSDVDRSRHFYRALGFRLAADERTHDARLVLLIPPGSACSIVLGTGLTTAAPGTLTARLTVDDLKAARAWLLAQGAEPEPVTSWAGHDTTTFSDPDGNRWILEQR
ncbi:VOC family protein [Kribbella sp. CA-293567]|uniref:VOC family protein n=1 Tax=Kribbella sp. CA-293567 TaxID=3002436 RepID=UPI0022DDB1FC|nr:VOC family protein [Kribbella sp. CA-293567]WBQ08176.1 VOC family protein [Kribbella sp. CA-293567]